MINYKNQTSLEGSRSYDNAGLIMTFSIFFRKSSSLSET